MDNSNYTNIISLARNPEDIGKVKLLLEINTVLTNKNVPDPYYGEFNDFEYVYDLIDTTCDLLVNQLKG
jgi:protein-tyrosine phosphatase